MRCGHNGQLVFNKNTTKVSTKSFLPYLGIQRHSTLKILAIVFLFAGVLLSTNSYAQYQWSPPIPIDTSRYPYAFGGEMALDDSDNIYVTFSSSQTNKLFVVRSSDRGTTWNQYEYAGTELSRIPRDIVVDHIGNVWLLWISRDDEFASAYVNLSRSTDSGKTFVTMFHSLAYADGFLYQKLAVDRQNSIYMLWDDVQFKITRFRYGDVAQRFDGEIPRDTFNIGSYPALTVTKDYEVHCVWEGSYFDSVNEYHSHIFYSGSSDTGKTIEPGLRVDTSSNSQPNFDVYHYPALAVDSIGTIFISFTKEEQVNDRAIRLVMSTDSGQSFTPPVFISGTDTAYSSLLCIDSQGGINISWGVAYQGERHYRSSDGGISFSLFSNIQNGLIELKAGKNGFLYATTGNDSGIAFTSTNIILSAEDDYEPNTFALFQNYPNPFNSSTTIRFSISKSTMVDLKVYDVTGREVSLLISKHLTPGSYNVSWDASNFSSGVYFVRLFDGHSFITRKIILIR